MEHEMRLVRPMKLRSSSTRIVVNDITQSDAVEPLKLVRKRKWSVVDFDYANSMIMPPHKIRKSAQADSFTDDKSLVVSNRTISKPRIKYIQTKISPEYFARVVNEGGKRQYIIRRPSPSHKDDGSLTIIYID